MNNKVLTKNIGEKTMGTINHAAENKLLELTNQDLESGNYPEYNSKENVGGNCRPAYPLIGFDNLVMWQPVLKFGYYEGACIDYIRKTNEYGGDFFGEIQFWMEQRFTIYENKENLSKIYDIDKYREFVKNELFNELNSKYTYYDRFDNRREFVPCKINKRKFNELIGELDILLYSDLEKIMNIFDTYFAERERLKVESLLDKLADEYELDEYAAPNGWCPNLIKQRKLNVISI